MSSEPDGAQRPGGVVHSYLGYDPQTFPPPRAPAGDGMAEAAFDHLVASLEQSLAVFGPPPFLATHQGDRRAREDLIRRRPRHLWVSTPCGPDSPFRL